MSVNGCRTSIPDDPVPGRLRPLCEEDLPLLRSWRNHPDIRRASFTTHTIGEREHHLWFSGKKKDPQSALFVYEEAKPLGFVAFHATDPDWQVAEWSFYKAPDAPRGCGFRMGSTALAHGFSATPLHRIFGQTLATNPGSAAYHLRLGFREEGCLRQHHPRQGQLVSVHIFGILKAEWQQQRDTRQKGAPS